MSTNSSGTVFFGQPIVLVLYCIVVTSHCFHGCVTSVGRICWEKTKVLMLVATYMKTRRTDKYWTQPHLMTCQNPGV